MLLFYSVSHGMCLLQGGNGSRSLQAAISSSLVCHCTLLQGMFSTLQQLAENDCVRSRTGSFRPLKHHTADVLRHCRACSVCCSSYQYDNCICHDFNLHEFVNGHRLPVRRMIQATHTPHLMLYTVAGHVQHAAATGGACEKPYRIIQTSHTPQSMLCTVAGHVQHAAAAGGACEKPHRGNSQRGPLDRGRLEQGQGCECPAGAWPPRVC